MLQKIISAAILSCIATTVAAQQLASLPATGASTSQVSSAGFSEYEISPQDTLNVAVFDVPQLSQTVQVDNAGNIALPLLGTVQAAGRTTRQLSQEIAAALNAKYVKDPVVTVTLKDAASQKVTVDGEVTQPGVYEIQPHATLTQAVALAHGPDPVADIHHVSIVRNTSAGRVITVYDLDDIHDGKIVDPALHANDEVVVDTSGTRQFVRDFGSAFSLVWLLKP